MAETNAYCGQPVKVQILMPSVSGNVIQSLSQVQLNGDGILLDQSAVRQRIRQMEFPGSNELVSNLPVGNAPVYSIPGAAARPPVDDDEIRRRTRPVYTYESTLTPLVAGRLSITAQGFTAGNQFTGGIVIQGNVTIPGARRSMCCWILTPSRSRSNRCRGRDCCRDSRGRSGNLPRPRPGYLLTWFASVRW
ncbi:MAG: hypothetical protein QM813_20085 [Verrucomicrobiota bacterium]